MKNYMLSTLPEVAWTYLRKNLSYQEEWHRQSSKAAKNSNYDLFPCNHQTRSDLNAKKWGLLAFANPANTQPPIWHPDTNNFTIIGETYTSNHGSPFISFVSKANVNIRGLRLLDKRLCLNISSAMSVIQLMFPPGTILDEHSNVSLNLTFDLDLPSQIEKTKALWDIAHGKAKKMSTIDSQAPRASHRTGWFSCRKKFAANRP